MYFIILIERKSEVLSVEGQENTVAKPPTPFLRTLRRRWAECSLSAPQRTGLGTVKGRELFEMERDKDFHLGPASHRRSEPV